MESPNRTPTLSPCGSHVRLSFLVYYCSVLPEMPFYHWPCKLETADPSIWEQSVATHEQWLKRLGELGSNVSVISTRPVIEEGKYYNEGFTWSSLEGYR